MITQVIKNKMFSVIHDNLVIENKRFSVINDNSGDRETFPVIHDNSGDREQNVFSHK